MPANVAVPKRQWRIRLAKIKQFFYYSRNFFYLLKNYALFREVSLHLTDLSGTIIYVHGDVVYE